MPAMLRLIAFALFTAITCAVAAEGTAPVVLANTKCIDGQAVDAKIEPVIIRVGGKSYSVRVASQENAEAIRKMDPAAAMKAIVAFNRDLTDQVHISAKP